MNLMFLYRVIFGLSFFRASLAVSVPEPIAYYPLDKIHGTSEINNRQPEGTAVGVSLAPGPDGQDGGSYQFAGQEDSYIEFPNNGGLDVQRSITISFWVYVEADVNDPALVTYSNPEINNVGVDMVIYGGTGVSFSYYNPSRRSFFSTLDSTSFDLATWRHVAGSYDYDTGYSRLWLDGKMVAERQGDAGVNLVTNNPITLGKTPSHDGYAFKGRVTQLKIFDIALTDEQISKTMILVGGEGGEDECSNVVCYNGGTCVPLEEGNTCQCQPGYIGQHCEWQKKGCYREVWVRSKKAMRDGIGGSKKNRKDVQAAVETCLKLADERKVQVFGVRRKYKCVTIRDSADFARYGSSEKCKEEGDYGVGQKAIANFVYILKKDQ